MSLGQSVDRAYPVDVARTVEKQPTGDAGSGLKIRWSDGVECFFDSDLLRRGCPCATCREKAGDSSHAKPLGNKPRPRKNLLNVIGSDSGNQLNLSRVWAVGNYALGIRWGDGHDSGIYTYDYLWQLREQALGSSAESGDQK